jgi:hypothetical protein
MDDAVTLEFYPRLVTPETRYALYRALQIVFEGGRTLTVAETTRIRDYFHDAIAATIQLRVRMSRRDSIAMAQTFRRDARLRNAYEVRYSLSDEKTILELRLDQTQVTRLSNKQFDELIQVCDDHLFCEQGAAIQQHMFWARFTNGEPVTLTCSVQVAKNVQHAISQKKLPCLINLKGE